MELFTVWTCADELAVCVTPNPLPRDLAAHIAWQWLQDGHAIRVDAVSIEGQAA